MAQDYKLLDWAAMSDDELGDRLSELLEEDYDPSEWITSPYIPSGLDLTTAYLNSLRINSINRGKVEQTGIHNDGRIYGGGDMSLASNSVLHNNKGALVISSDEINNAAMTVGRQQPVLRGGDLLVLDTGAGGAINNIGGLIETTNAGSTLSINTGELNNITLSQMETVTYGKDYKKVETHIGETATISSAGNASIPTSGDLNMAGSRIAAADDADIDIDGDLNVASLQNSSDYSDKTNGFNVNPNAIAVGVTSGSNGGSREWTDNQTTIIGSESVAINVAGNTDNTGAVIANATRDENGKLLDGGNLSLTTGSLTYDIMILSHQFTKILLL
jgi:filamentous hemagglutinin